MGLLTRLSVDDERWLDFVSSRSEATPFHHPAWTRTITDTYGLVGFALALVDDAGELVAGLPFVERRRPLRARTWVSLPYTDHCAPLGSGADASGFLAAVENERRARGVGGLEVRSEARGCASLREAPCGFVHVLTLTDYRSADDLYAGLSKSRVHRSVRRARDAGVEVRVSADKDDLTSVFYRLHLLTRRRQGVPIQPRRFFEHLWNRMVARGLASTYVAEIGEQPVAAAVFLRWNGTTVYKFGASDPARLDARPNHALFWAAIEASFGDGARSLDFGRSDADNEGLRAFKEQWGAIGRPLVYSSTDGQPRRAGLGWVAPASRAVIRFSPPWVCRLAGERLYRFVS